MLELIKFESYWNLMITVIIFNTIDFIVKIVFNAALLSRCFNV